MKFVYAFINSIVSVVSLEFLFTEFKWPNGGTVIFVRTTGITVLVYFIYILIVQSLDPMRTDDFNADELAKQIINSLDVFGAVYAAIYIALYSRFSAQWSYLSNLYNQIKVIEASSGANLSVINELKAAFIEDAIELHLSRKPMFAMIIKSWSSDPAIRALIEQNMKDGPVIYDELMEDINKIV